MNPIRDLLSGLNDCEYLYLREISETFTGVRVPFSTHAPLTFPRMISTNRDQTLHPPPSQNIETQRLLCALRAFA
jgi:hypothetical protein